MTTTTIQWTTGAPTKPGRYVVTVVSPYGHMYTSIEIFDALRRWNINNPKPPGFRIPNSEKHQFRKGTSIRSRQGDEAQLRATAKRIETIKKERRRILFGLPQKTNL